MADKKTILVAVDVINGDYGNGDKRVKALKKKGYDPKVVQNEVNRLMTQSKKKSIDTLAHEVIDGYWRSGAKREKVLKACGCNYNAIQKWYGTLAKGEDDNEFGKKTLDAFKDFQKKEGLVVDGECGAKSITKMREVVR